MQNELISGQNSNRNVQNDDLGVKKDAKTGIF